MAESVISRNDLGPAPITSSAMGLNNAMKFGAIGLAADAFAWPVTMGQGIFLGAIAGLFTPDSKDMDAAYAGDRFQNLPKHYLGFPMTEGLFGNTQGGPRDPAPTKREWPGWAKAAAVGVGALMLGRHGGAFSFPLYSWAAGLTPYNSGGLMPLAWSNGLIPSWGWSAGFFT